MWNRAEEVPEKEANSILERYDQTDEKLRRMIVLQLSLDVLNLRAQLNAVTGGKRHDKQIDQARQDGRII